MDKLAELLLSLIVLSGVGPQQVLDGGKAALEEADYVEDRLVGLEFGLVPYKLREVSSDWEFLFALNPPLMTLFFGKVAELLVDLLEQGLEKVF